MSDDGALMRTHFGEQSSALLGVAIVNYYSAESVGSLLESLAHFSGDLKIAVCVVDNSDDPTGQELRRVKNISELYATALMDVSVLKAPRNLGYGAGNNLAAVDLLGKGANFIWVLNPDTSVLGNAVDLLAEMQTSSADVWATSTFEHAVRTKGFGTLNTYTGTGKSSNADGVGKRIFRLDYPAGHSILFRGEAWTRLGGFDERYFLFMEEADMSLRASMLGLGVGTVASVLIEHDAGLTTGSTSDLSTKSVIAYREATRSRVIFFRRHFPARVALIVVLRLVYAVLVFLRGNRQGSLAVLQGLLAGVREVSK